MPGVSDPSTCFAPDQPLSATGIPNTGLQSPGIANQLGVQINPSNTGNIRGQSRFTLTDGLILTVDPTYQYVLANGGSQGVRIAESDNIFKQGVPGALGVDLNGDGDFPEFDPRRPSFDHQHEPLHGDQLAGVEDGPEPHVPRRLHLRSRASPPDW